MRRFFVAAAAVAILALIAAGVGSAGREQMQLTCDGFGMITVTATSTTADPSVAWGTAKISGGVHLIPVSFAGTFTDTTQGLELFSFSSAKGEGSGMHNQRTITCTQEETGTVRDLGGIPGIPDADTVVSDFTAIAVVKP